MPVRLFLGYFVALAVCATFAFASFGSGDADAPDSLASEQAVPWQPLPASAFYVHPPKVLPKHLQYAQAN